uniref:3-beta hydroxysteroid dehydrogenase/isomerase domain-containing protein n=1 Tax=Lotharella oceanica TaxID=641309 RepID=A0A7S2XAU1_9EUKA
MEHKNIEWVQGDLTKPEDVEKACKGSDVVFHIAAVVGPYYPMALYERVNYQGTVNVVNACKKLGIKKIVMSSSPSTRFDPHNLDIVGKREDELKFPDERTPPRGFTAEYARTKAMGERYCRKENNPPKLMTVAVAPHQVYGPRDGLMLPNLLEAAGTGRLRIFGEGKNLISFTHVDNYCHGLILAEKALYEGSPALGKFYIVTDGPPQSFWDRLDEAVVGVGYQSLHTKYHLPVWLLMTAACLSECITYVTGMHLKLNRFAVKMLTIHRWFDISNAEKDLKYKPVVKFEDGWKSTIAWFKENWMTGKTSFKCQPPGLKKAEAKVEATKEEVRK